MFRRDGVRFCVHHQKQAEAPHPGRSEVEAQRTSAGRTDRPDRPYDGEDAVSGYGEGVAADTGGGVRGGTIDLWFPSTAEALSWGRRVVTITLH